MVLMRTLLFSALLLVPSVAYAHEGPPHVHGDDPHVLGAALCFAVVGAVTFGLRRLAARKAVRS
jgi:hypothetical protein